MKRFYVTVLAFAIAAGLVLPRVGAAQTPIVKIEQVDATGGGISRVFFGHVVARETVDLAFQVAGQIVQFPLDEGANVAKGGLVASLDRVPFELALEEARAKNEQAVRTLERYRQLLGSAVSRTTVQDAETAVELADVALRNAERALEQATLNAPFDALVASRLLPNFSTTSAGTPVVRLHDMSDLRIEIEVPEILFQRAGKDPSVEIFAQFAGHAPYYPVEVREVNAETADVGQTYALTLGMAPRDDLTVWPGSSAKVTAKLMSDTAQITVPASAIIVGNDGSTHVMVFSPKIDNEGIVTKTAVEIAASENGEVQVLSGLKQGQEIVTIGGATLSDAQTVRRFTGFGG